MSAYTNYITSDYQVMLGKPVLKGTRLTVELLLRKLAQGATHADILSMYPFISQEHIWAVLEYAADVLANEDTTLSAA